MIETTGSSVIGRGRGAGGNHSESSMNLPPIPEDWRTNWHLAAHLDQFTAGDAIEVTVAGISLHIRNAKSGLSARSDARAYPVMVVDDEIFVLLGDGPH